MSISVAVAPLSERTEDDAFRAYSLIQSLLNGDGSPFGQSPNEFGSPLQAIDTPSQQHAIDTPSQQRLVQSAPGFTGTSSRFSEAHLTDSQQSGHRGASINEQSLLYEEVVPMGNRLPTENTFHSMLLNSIEPSPAGGVRGASAVDLSDQANIVGCYANAIQGSYRDAIREAFKLGMDPFSDHDLGTRSSVGQWNSNDLRVHRAERDLWSLLEMLTAANLLADLDDRQCQSNLDVALSLLSVMASIPEHINAAYQADPRLRKGAIVREWIERAVVDRVVEPPVIRSDPYGETLARLSKTRHDRSRSRSSAVHVQSLHPDGQLSYPDGCLLALDGSDQRDQESLLKAIWQLVRSGQVTRAHQLAAERHMYWLAAALQGMTYHHHEPIIVPGADGASSELVGTARMGNTRQPVWVKSCLAYSNKLAAAASSWNNNSFIAASPSKAIGSRSLPRGSSGSASLAALLEMSIFAALSNNTRVLLSSPLISSWHDRLWVYLKAAHDRDITAIVHRYRTGKAAFSGLFPGCDEKTLSVERELLDLGASELSHVSTGNCIHILNKVPPPHNEADVESLVLGMQAAIIEGASGWTHYVQTTMTTMLSSDSSSSLIGREHLLRIYCHVCIWVKHGPVDDATNFAATVTDEVMYAAIEAYIDHLIQQKQHSLIAAYAVYLSRARRIVKYAQLLQSMQASATNDAASKHLQLASFDQSTDALEVLQLAKTYFPAEVIEITRAVAERVGDIPSMDAKGRVDSNSSSLVVAERASIRAAPPLRQVGSLKIRPRPMKSSFATPSSAVQMSPSGPSTAADAHRHRVSSSMDLSSVVTAEETQKMEALRWLFLDPLYVLEAVQQANRLAVKLLSSHRQSLRIGPLRSIVSDYIPSDAGTVGEALLQLRRDALDDEQAQLKSLQSETGSMDTEEAAAVAGMATALSSRTALLQMEEDSWKAQVAKLQLWTSIVRSQQDVAVFNRSVDEFEGVRANLISTSTGSMVASLGRFRSTIVRSATVAVDSIYSAITCSSGSSENKNKSTNAVGTGVVTGYKEVWDLTETSAKQLLQYNLSSLNDSIILYSSDTSVASTIAASEWIEIRSLLDSLLQSIRKGVSTEEGTISTSVFRTHEVVLRDLLEQIDAALSSCSHRPQTIAAATASGESSAPIIAMLKECIQLVVDVQLGSQLCGILLYHLLSSSIQFNTPYLKVCLTAATVLESLTYDRDAEAWYQRVLKLSELIASEDYSLQLYSILHRDDLESLLLSINTAALALLSRNNNNNSLMG